MNFETVNRLVGSLGTMKYFPSDEVVRLALVELMSDLTDDEERVRWLVKRVRTVYAEWPGEQEVRACFCWRFRPKDGINAYSQLYETFPPDPVAERERKLLAGPEQKALPSPEEAKPIPQQTEAALRIGLAVQRIKQSAFDGPATPAEIAAAPEWLRRLEGYE